MSNLIDLGHDLHHWVDISRLDTDSIVIDAGANVGSFIEVIRTYVDCKIIAVECGKTNIAHIKNKNFENVYIIGKALVGDSSQPITLTEIVGESKSDGTMRYNQWHNIYGNHSNHSAQVNTYVVGGVTLKELVEDYGTIDYLKMDIEGAEYEVIESLTHEDAQKIKQISLECHDENQNSRLEEVLISLGYEVFWKANSEIYATIMYEYDLKELNK
jgi:FkbM family methyltransferase